MRFTVTRRSQRFLPVLDVMETRLVLSAMVLDCPMDATILSTRPTTPVLVNPMDPVLLTPPPPIFVARTDS